MDLTKFCKEVSRVNKILSKEEIESIVDKSIQKYSDFYGVKGHLNALKVMEECSELSQAISKAEISREKAKCKNYTAGLLELFSLLEEMADVYLGLLYLKNIYEITDDELLKAITVKANRESLRNEKTI